MNKKKSMVDTNRILFEKIIEDAIIDCYGEDEQIAGWACLLEENIPVPCKCLIGEEPVTLNKIEQGENSNVIFGKIKFEKIKIRIPIGDITLEDPETMKYIEAYDYWRKNG